MSLPESDETQKVEQFLQLFAQHQRQLYFYIMSLVPRQNDAEDVLQETNLVLWREFDQFEIGTNFLAWSSRVAYNQVLAWRKKQSRDRLSFSEEFLSAVSQEIDQQADYLEDRYQALSNCLAKLPDHHRELLIARYRSGQAVQEIATSLNRKADAVYQMLSRIRHSLHDCISQTISHQELS